MEENKISKLKGTKEDRKETRELVNKIASMSKRSTGSQTSFQVHDHFLYGCVRIPPYDT